MQLQITAVKQGTKSLVVSAGDGDYFAKKDSGISGLLVGKTIDAEVEVSNYNGKVYKWIGLWKESAAPQVSPKTQVERTGAAPSPSAAAAPLWGNFVSNQVAHAIQAGLITDPSHLKVWAAAAKQAYMELSDVPF